MDYNKTTLIKRWVSGTAGLRFKISFPKTFLIKKVWLVCSANGTEATHRFRVSDNTGATHYIDRLVGTFSANDVILINMPEETRAFAGGTSINFTNVVNTSGSYEVFVLCAHEE